MSLVLITWLSFLKQMNVGSWKLKSTTFSFIKMCPAFWEKNYNGSLFFLHAMKAYRDVRSTNPYLLTPWCRVLLEKLTGLQPVKKYPAFHGTRTFITALTSVRHLSLSWVSPIQSIYPQPTSWRSILILSTRLYLSLPSGLLPSGFPTKTLYTSLSSTIRETCPAHLIILDYHPHNFGWINVRHTEFNVNNLLWF